MNSNLFKFIQSTKSPFIAIQTRFAACENGEEKKKYKGLVKNYNELSYEESVSHYKDVEHKYNYNQILFKVPKNIMVIDTDTEKVYKYIVKVLSQYELYNETNIFKSFSGVNNDLYFKRHFIFKYETDTGGLKRKFQGLDLFNNTWGVAEWLDSEINYNDLQTINIETVEHIIKHNEKIIKQINKTIGQNRHNNRTNNNRDRPRNNNSTNPRNY